MDTICLLKFLHIVRLLKQWKKVSCQSARRRLRLHCCDWSMVAYIWCKIHIMSWFQEIQTRSRQKKQYLMVLILWGSSCIYGGCLITMILLVAHRNHTGEAWSVEWTQFIPNWRSSTSHQTMHTCPPSKIGGFNDFRKEIHWSIKGST